MAIHANSTPVPAPPLLRLRDARGRFMRPDLPPLLAAATLHARRELGNALEFGFALLDALGLSPLALDVIDDGIAALDAMDAADTDLEPSLGAPEQQEDGAKLFNGRWIPVQPDQRHWADGSTSDREAEITDEPHDDEGDAEPSIGWPEDFTAKLDDALQADHDPEFDDADLERDFRNAPSIYDPIWGIEGSARNPTP